MEEPTNIDLAETSGASPPSLSLEDRLELRASALTDETIDKLVEAGLVFTGTNEQNRRLLDLTPEDQRDVGGLVFMYNESYARVKPRARGGKKKTRADERAESIREDHDFTNTLRRTAETKAEGPKYLNPAGRRLPAYLPPESVLPRSVLADQRLELFITEGEKKALALAARGAAAVGIGGVDCAHDEVTDNTGEFRKILKSEIASLIRPGREVVILFDAPDMVEKPGVIRAAIALGKMIADAGGIPLVGYVPALSGREKTGVDDWLASNEAPNEPPTAITFRARNTDPLKQLDEARAEQCGDYIENIRPGDQSREFRAEVIAWAAVAIRTNKDWVKWKKKAAKVFGVEPDANVFSEAELRLRERSSGPVISFVDTWLQRNGVTFNPDTMRFERDKMEIRTDVLVDRIFVDSPRYGRDKITSAIRVKIDDQWTKAWNSLRARLKHVATLESALGEPSPDAKRFLKAITGSEEPLDIAVVLHFIWQVKRKLHGLEVTNHLMPIFCRMHQQGGKSTVVRKLLAPLGQHLVATGLNLSALNDDRNNFRFTENLVLMFDEMSGADRADIESLKRMITASRVDWRMMRTNSQTGGTNIATLIGTANKAVVELLYDDTGMKRFHEIICLETLDHETINTIDYLRLWTSVDENQESPLVPFLPELRARQEEMRPRSEVEEWMAENLVKDPAARMTPDTLHKLFNEHFYLYRYQDTKRLKRQTFLARVGVMGYRVQDGGLSRYCLMVKAGSPLEKYLVSTSKATAPPATTPAISSASDKISC